MTSTLRQTLGGLLGWFLLFPSLGIVQKYLGSWSSVAFAVVGLATCLILVAHCEAVRDWVERIHPRRARLLTAVVIITFALVFALVYPVANGGDPSWLVPSGMLGGGSDRDDALSLGARALLDGRYPYYERTYLGNPLSPLPGSVLLALPFAVLGNAAWQNLAWVGLWPLLLVRIFADARAGLAVALLTLAASPVVLQDLLTGGDLAVNSVIVLAAVTLTAQAIRRPWLLTAAAAFAGLAFATRGLFVLLLPLLLAFVHKRAGARAALKYFFTLAAMAAIVILPFYLYDPVAFVPFATQNKFRFLTSVLPRADVLLPALSVAVAAVAPVFVRRAAWPWWLVAGGLVLSVPAGLFVALSMAAGSRDLVSTSYAMPGLFFGVPGVCLLLWQRE